MSKFAKRERMREDVLEGRPVSPFEIIDIHGHLGYWFNFNIPWRNGADMVRMMDAAGVRCVVASGHSGIGPDFKLGNEQVIDAMRKHPGRILGYCSVNPNYPTKETADELKRCFDAGMVGIKLHPSVHRQRADAEGYRPAWEFAQKRKLCVLSHTGAGDAFCGIHLFEQLAMDYPAVKIILGHSGFGYDGATQCFELARKRDNVFLDITGSLAYRGLIGRMVKAVGADRVLYGTDMPFIDCRPQVGRLAFSELDDKQLSLVLGSNARRLFGI